MYRLEILVNNDSDYNAKLDYSELEDCAKVMAIILEQGYEVKVSESWEDSNA